MTKKPSYEELEKKLHDIEKENSEQHPFEQAMRLVQYAINRARDTILWMNRETRILYANDAACRSLKYSRDELLSMKIGQVDPNFNPEFWNARLEELHQVKSHQFESQHRTKDGYIFPVEIVSSFMIFEGEEGCLSVVRNITERKQAERDLKKSEERYRLIAQNVTDVIWTTDSDFNLTYISPSVYHLRGYTVEEAMQQSIDERLLPDSLKQTKKLHEHNKNLILSGDPEGWAPTIHESELYCKDGSTIWTQNNVKMLPGSDGLPERFLGVTRDITERKHAEQALKESEKRYRSMMEAMKDAIYICSPDFKIDYMNSAMIKRVGRDATGESCYETIYKNKDRCSWCIFDEIKKHRSIEYEFENPADHRVYSISSFPIEGPDGSDSKLTISRDITEVKIIKEQLQRTHKMESIGTLAGGIAHDFNNILSGIFGYSQLAEMHLDDPVKTKQNIEQVIAGATRAKDLVQQILTLSRKGEHKKHPTQIYLIVREAIKFLHSSIPATIEIKENIQSRAMVLADPTQIHQIVINLCTNAYHAMREKSGVLSVTLTQEEIREPNSIPGLSISPGTYLKLDVSDTGSGMSPETLNRIFDPYFTTKEIGEGTGLGLAVVLGIIEEHNGYVKAYSQPGKGSQFDVYLPVLKTQVDTHPLERMDEPLQGGFEKIMLIDDEVDLLKTTQNILSQYGYQVKTFTSGVKALEAFRKAPDQTDLVITDMTMPKITGEELSFKLLNIRSNLPIIMCTGFSENFSEAKATALGIKKYIQKPIDRQTLLALIRDVLKNNN